MPYTINQQKINRSLQPLQKLVYDFDAGLFLFGLSGSISLTEANSLQLKTVHEVFADRSYQDDGSLTPRSQPNAFVENEQKAVQQILQMINEQTVTSTSGKIVPVKADTICIHGDGKKALAFATTISSALKQANIDIKAN